MTPNDRFKGHFEFLDHLDETIDTALKQYHDAKEGDLEELRHLQREVGMARRTLADLCEKFTQPISDGEVEEVTATAKPETDLSEKAAANA